MRHVLRLACALLALAIATPVLAGPIVVLRSRALPIFNSTSESFRRHFRGPVENLVLDPETPGRTESRVARLHPDAIVAIGLRAALFARDRFPRVPLVYAMVPDPERHELLGAGITGVSASFPADVELTAFARAVSGSRAIGVVCTEEWAAARVRPARAAASRAGVVLREILVKSPADLASALSRNPKSPDALWLPADPALASPEVFHYLLTYSLQHRIPLLTFAEPLVRTGAFAAVAPDYDWLGHHLADTIRRIQQGERPGDVPRLSLQRARLVMNSATARALGVKLSAADLGAESLVP